MRSPRTLLCAALLVATAACENAADLTGPNARPLPDAAPVLASDVRDPCIRAAIPSGYVILRYSWNGICAPPYDPSVSNYFNVTVIGLPGPTETVCATSPIPAGYGVIGQGRSQDCLYYSATAFNTLTIQFGSASPITLCTSQETPSGYMNIGYGQSSACPYYSAVGFNTKTVVRPKSPQTACTTSTVPGSWVITQYLAELRLPELLGGHVQPVHGPDCLLGD